VPFQNQIRATGYETLLVLKKIVCRTRIDPPQCPRQANSRPCGRRPHSAQPSDRSTLPHRALPSDAAEDHLRCAARPIWECSFNASNRKTIVAPPAERAADRAKGKHGAQLVKQVRLTWFEMDRVATRAGAPEPQHARQPIRPDYGRMIHRRPSFCETTARTEAHFHFPSVIRGARRIERGVNP